MADSNSDALQKSKVAKSVSSCESMEKGSEEGDRKNARNQIKEDKPVLELFGEIGGNFVARVVRSRWRGV